MQPGMMHFSAQAVEKRSDMCLEDQQEAQYLKRQRKQTYEILRLIRENLVDENPSGALLILSGLMNDYEESFK